MLTGSLGLALLCVVVVVAGCVAVTAEAKHHFIGNALMDMKDSIELSFKLGKAVVSVLMEELTEDIIEAQKRLALRTLQKDSQDIPSVISSVIGVIQSVTPYQKLDRDLTIPPVEVFPADKGKDIGVTIFPKPILDIPDVDSIPATEREKNVIIENPPYIPKSIIDIFPEHVNQGETIIRMDEGNGSDYLDSKIDERTLKELKKYNLDKKYEQALKNGYAQRRQGTNGIIKLSENEIVIKSGKKYTHKLKVTKAGDHLRVYGYISEEGVLIFDYVVKGK